MKKYQLKTMTLVTLLILTIVQLFLPFVATAKEITGQTNSFVNLEEINLESDDSTNQLIVHLSFSKSTGDISEQIITFSKELLFTDSNEIVLYDQNEQTIGNGSLKDNKLRLKVDPTYQGSIMFSLSAPASSIPADSYLKIESANFSKEILLPTKDVLPDISEQTSEEETALSNQSTSTEQSLESKQEQKQIVTDLPIQNLITPTLQTIPFQYSSGTNGDYLTNNDQGKLGENTLNYAYGNTTEAPFDDEGYVNYNDEAYIKKTAQEVTESQGLFNITLDIKGNELPNPIDIALVVDYSSTMNGQKLENAINGIKEFLNQIDVALSNGKVRVGIIAYNREAYTQPFTTDKDELVRFLEDSSKSHSGTFIQKGLVAADNLFETSAKPDVQRKIIVHIGDGSANRAYYPADDATLYTNDGQITSYNGFSDKTYYRDFATDSPLFYTSNQSVVDSDPNATFMSAKEIANLTLGTSVDLKQKGYDFYSIGVAPSDRGEYIDKNIASSEAKYLPIDADLVELGDALSNIAAKVEHTIPNGTVLDPMGDQILLQKSGADFTPTDYKLQGLRKNASGVWVDAPELLTKVAVSEKDTQLNLSGLTLGKDERLTLTYQVRIDTEASSFIPDHWYLANGRTTLDTTSNGTLVDFPIPSVKAPGTKVMVEKNWLDHNDQLGLRPDSISVVLSRTTVTSTAWQDSQPLLLSKPIENSNQWQFVIDSVIPKDETTSVALAAFNNKGENFTYSVNEINTDSNYIATSEHTQGKIVLTNRLDRTDLTFTKVDEENQPLQGVTFKLLDDQGKQVSEIQTSDQNGYVTFQNLERGNYQLIEVAPLSGYQTIDSVYITIDQDQQGNLSVTAPEGWDHKIINKKIVDKTTPSNIETPKRSGQIPKAGENAQSWLLIIGLLILVSVAYLYYRKVHNKNG